MDKLNHDQEVKFMKYVTAADELIEHLRNENRRLHEQTNNLRSEAASIRSSTDEQKAEYQKLLKEEKQKNNQLSEEIERLRYLQLEGLCCSAREGNTENGQLNMSGRSQVGSGILNGSDVNVTRKRSRHYGTSADITVAPYSSDQLEHAPGRESASDLSKKTLSRGTDSVVDQPECESASDLSKKTLSGGTDSVVDQLLRLLLHPSVRFIYPVVK
ncbi:hypothetical protein C3L33_05893, partial [Rhododendron williamsianum]